MKKISQDRKTIVLTGGPCGGKTTIIKELCKDKFWKKRIVIAPEAVFYALQTNISTCEKRFQKIVVEIQSSMEATLNKYLDNEIIICHRGTLDPLAYWQYNNWYINDFFSYTKTTYTEHYERYSAILHLQTAAINAVESYTRYPDTHRGETVQQAIMIDNLLNNAWRNHPKYFYIENKSGGWKEKKDTILGIIKVFIKHDN